MRTKGYALLYYKDFVITLIKLYAYVRAIYIDLQMYNCTR